MNRLLTVAAVVLLTSCATAKQPARRAIRAQYEKLDTGVRGADIDAVSPDEIAVHVTQRETRMRTAMHSGDVRKVGEVDQIDLKNRDRWIDGVVEARSSGRRRAGKPAVPQTDFKRC